MKLRRLPAVTVAVLLGASSAAVAQLPAGTPGRDSVAARSPACARPARLHVDDLFSFRMEAARVLELAGATPVEPMIVRRPSSEAETPLCLDQAPALAWAVDEAPASSGVELRLVPITGELVANSAYPKDRNNGALWAGVGPTWALSGGVHARWRWLSASIDPRIIHSANGDFTFPAVTQPGRSPYGDASEPQIDWPRRFGDRSFSTFDPGQSYVRADAYGAAVGFSTENVWLGPSEIHPIMMSSTAPGFPHVFAGTSRPIRTPIGRLEAQVMWGHLTESGYFDADSSNDKRLFTALVADWMPRWIPGLTLGLATMYLDTIPPGGLSLAHQFRMGFPASFSWVGGGNRHGDGLGALYARWALPSAGFEVYGEWTREDTPYNLQDLLAEPDWTQAYALGFNQAIRTGPRMLRFYGELTHLGEAAPTRDGKGDFSYYTHGQVIQGVTNRGQLIGAALGPGSDGETLGLDLHYGRGMTGLWVERARYDEDAYYRTWGRRYGESRHDWEVTGGVRQAARFGPLELEGVGSFSKRRNRYFTRLADFSSVPLVENNWYLDLRASWAPRLPLPRRAASAGATSPDAASGRH